MSLPQKESTSEEQDAIENSLQVIQGKWRLRRWCSGSLRLHQRIAPDALVLTDLATFRLVRNSEVLAFLPQSKSPGPAFRMSGLTSERPET